MRSSTVIDRFILRLIGRFGLVVQLAMIQILLGLALFLISALPVFFISGFDDVRRIALIIGTIVGATAVGTLVGGKVFYARRSESRSRWIISWFTGGLTAGFAILVVTLFIPNSVNDRIIAVLGFLVVVPAGTAFLGFLIARQLGRTDT